VSANERPETPDGVFRVVLISSGSVASVKIPDVVGALSKASLAAVIRVPKHACLTCRTPGSRCKS